MQIDFEPEGHVYRMNGQVVPSVTQVLSLLEDWTHVDPEVLQAARVFGNHVHDAVHLWNMGELDWDSLDKPLVRPVEQWAEFIEENRITIIASEIVVAHPLLKCAGRLDTLVEWQKRRCIRGVLDVKSGQIPRTVGPQTSAYKEFYEHLNRPCVSIARRDCVQLTGEVGKPAKLKQLANRTDFPIFQSALNCWRFKNGH